MDRDIVFGLGGQEMSEECCELQGKLAAAQSLIEKLEKEYKEQQERFMEICDNCEEVAGLEKENNRLKDKVKELERDLLLRSDGSGTSVLVRALEAKVKELEKSLVDKATDFSEATAEILHLKKQLEDFKASMILAKEDADSSHEAWEIAEAKLKSHKAVVGVVESLAHSDGVLRGVKLKWRNWTLTEWLLAVIACELAYIAGWMYGFKEFFSDSF